MKVITFLRLYPSSGDEDGLLECLRRFNAAVQSLSGIAFREKLWDWLPLRRRAYRELRDRLSLGCGQVERRNRPRRDLFRCVDCGLAGPADAVAAENIRWAAGRRPYATVQLGES